MTFGVQKVVEIVDESFSANPVRRDRQFPVRLRTGFSFLNIKDRNEINQMESHNFPFKHDLLIWCQLFVLFFFGFDSISQVELVSVQFRVETNAQLRIVNDNEAKPNRPHSVARQWPHDFHLHQDGAGQSNIVLEFRAHPRRADLKLWPPPASNNKRNGRPWVALIRKRLI